jgi:hypothetical protein
MSNLFKEVLQDAQSVEEELLGPDYKYWKQIKSPAELGITTKGSVSAISNDVNGLINYVELLVTGNSKASRTGKPLGDKFFLKTFATCKDKKSSNVVDRYIYVNNVPDGSIPFISGAMNMNFSEMEGLVPGTMSNLSSMNPMLIFQAFMSGSQPICEELTMETIDVNNNKSTETRHVTTIDIQNINPCSFPGKKNPISGKKCRESFTNINMKNRTYIPDDFLVKLFYTSLGVMGIYILILVMKRINGKK